MIVETGSFSRRLIRGLQVTPTGTHNGTSYGVLYHRIELKAFGRGKVLRNDPFPDKTGSGPDGGHGVDNLFDWEDHFLRNVVGRARFLRRIEARPSLHLACRRRGLTVHEDGQRHADLLGHEVVRGRNIVIDDDSCCCRHDAYTPG